MQYSECDCVSNKYKVYKNILVLCFVICFFVWIVRMGKKETTKSTCIKA